MLLQMGAKRDKHPFEANPFMDGLLEWMGSSEGQQYIEMSDVLQMLLDHVKLDPLQREFVWLDGERLSFDQVVKRIRKQHPEFPKEDVHDYLIRWIENYGPEGLNQTELDEFDRLGNDWADELREHHKC
jgi:hypothetical protein